MQDTPRVERYDSSLGSWTVVRWCPPSLAGLVDHMWHFSGRLSSRRERIFPDGRLELIVHFGAVYRQADASGSGAFPPTSIGGLLLGPCVIEAPPEPSEILGIRLHPAGAYALLRRPMDELAGLTVDLDDVVGRTSAELAERCAAEPTPQRRLQVAAAWLASQLCIDAIDPAVAWAADEIDRRSGVVAIGAIQERTGWSKSRFNATFRRQIGVTPKVFARVVRFRRALELVTGCDGPLGWIAHAAGYYDQAHFNTEFRQLSGFAPGALRAATRFPDSVNVADPPA